MMIFFIDNDKFTFDTITSCLNKNPDSILTGFKLNVYKKHAMYLLCLMDDDHQIIVIN